MNEESLETLKRQINANALALRGLAQFAMYQTSLDHILDPVERNEMLSTWVKGAGSTILQNIDELEAYGPGNSHDENLADDTPQSFLVNTSMLALNEIGRLIPRKVFAELLLQIGGVPLLLRLAEQAAMMDSLEGVALSPADMQKFREILKIMGVVSE